MRGALESEIGQPGLFALVPERCPYLFASRPVFVSHAHMSRMAHASVRAVESVVALPAYRAEVLANSPAIAQHDPGGARGVFFGYDFHVADRAFGLIEINTNAGGAMLNSVLARAQRACCPEIDELMPAPVTADVLEEHIVSMFRDEWSLSGRARPLHSIAFVDENPVQQYLYPEFVLFRQLFQRHGLQAVIAGPTRIRLSRWGAVAQRTRDRSGLQPADGFRARGAGPARPCARPTSRAPPCSRRTRRRMPCTPTSAISPCSAMRSGSSSSECRRPPKRFW